MKAKVVKNVNVNVEPLKVNEYIEQQKQKALMRAELIDELTTILTNKLTKELSPEIRKEVMLEIEMNHYLVPKKKEEIDVDYLINLIIGEVTQAFKITQYEVLISKSRKAPIPDARCVISYICRAMHNMSYTKIAKTLNKNHATIIYSRKKCQNIMETDKGFKCLVEQIIKSINDKINESK